jgi:hypothetical protein
MAAASKKPFSFSDDWLLKKEDWDTYAAVYWFMEDWHVEAWMLLKQHIEQGVERGIPVELFRGNVTVMVRTIDTEFLKDPMFNMPRLMSENDRFNMGLYLGVSRLIHFGPVLLKPGVDFKLRCVETPRTSEADGKRIFETTKGGKGTNSLYPRILYPNQQDTDINDTGNYTVIVNTERAKLTRDCRKMVFVPLTDLGKRVENKYGNLALRAQMLEPQPHLRGATKWRTQPPEAGRSLVRTSKGWTTQESAERGANPTRLARYLEQQRNIALQRDPETELEAQLKLLGINDPPKRK